MRRFLTGLFAVGFGLFGGRFSASAGVTVDEGNGVHITMENAAVKMDIAVEAGGRISRLINKKTGKNLVVRWGQGYGGALGGHTILSYVDYHAEVLRPGGQEGRVRLTARHASGLSTVKIITLHEDDPEIQVQETLSNGTSKPVQFMVQNFLLPNGSPLTSEDEYFLPVKGKPLLPLTPANGWFDQLASPWSAIWNKKTGAGILVAAPGIDQFYFWQASKVYPTYEWAYPNVPAGHSLTVRYKIRLVNDPSPDWARLSKSALKGMGSTRLAQVPGWQNERQRYKVTPNEEKQGFWLSTGDGPGKRRLPDTLRIDAPLNESRSVYVAINALKNLTQAELSVRFEGIPESLIQLAWQEDGKDTVKVIPFASRRKIDLPNDAEGRLWMTLKQADHAGDYSGRLVIDVNNQSVSWPLEARVWAVKVPAIRPFDVRGYGAYPHGLAGTYEVTPQSTRRLNTFYQYYAAMGGNDFDWTVVWPRLCRYVKIAGTDQTVHAWLKKHKKAYADKPADQWPKIDFSYYDPWFNVAKAHGITRVTGYLAMTPKDYFPPVQEQWVLEQFKAYLAPRGFHGFFCKIGDEIAADSLSDYIRRAKVVQAAEWRPWTTVTGVIARTSSLINEMNPYCDDWQLHKIMTRLFDDAIHKPYQLRPATLTLPTQWSHYTNGGARNTFTQQLFGTLIDLPRDKVDGIKVYQDNQELSLGSSPGGNQQTGVFFTVGKYIYIAPAKGTRIETSVFKLHYNIRTPNPDGHPLASIDPTDDVSFYGGGSRPYATPYAQAAAYPLKALAGGYQGYGWYALFRHNAHKVIWYDPATEKISVGPAYLGLKDGWNDARLIGWLDKEKMAPMSDFISENPDAPLRMGIVEPENNGWKDLVNATDPFILNAARRQALAAAAHAPKP